MSKAHRYRSFDFTQIKAEQVQRIVRDIYVTHPQERRSSHVEQSGDRRRNERRQRTQAVLLDTRTHQSRRRSGGRRAQDENPDNKHKVGIDYYA